MFFPGITVFVIVGVVCCYRAGIELSSNLHELGLKFVLLKPMLPEATTWVS